MPENKEVRSGRERFLDKIRGKYPDREFGDDEALFEQINDDYDDYDGRLKRYEEDEKALGELYSRDPRSASFLAAWKSGKHPAVALVEMFGDDFVEELKDPKRQEELAKASKEYAERVAKEKEYDEIYQNNIEETREMIEGMKGDEGLTDDDINRAMSFLATIVRDGILGKFSKESVHLALKALDYDDDVEQAGAEGELKGRNAKIEEKLRKRKGGDTLPQLGGQNGVENEKKKPQSIFDVAKGAM